MPGPRPVPFSSSINLLGLSPMIWGSGFPTDEILTYRDRNSGYGFYDDFDGYYSNAAGSAALVGPYGTEVAASGTITQVAETFQGENGILDVHFNGTNSSEACVQRSGTGIPFAVANTDLAFECRIRLSAITTAKFAWFIGLAQPDSLNAAHAITTGATPVLYGSDDFVGFWKPITPYSSNGGGGAVSACFQNGSATYNVGAAAGSGLSQGLVDGSLSTSYNQSMGNLGGTATTGAVVASTGSVTNYTLVGTYVPSWIQLGFRYYAAYQRLSWFVNGSEITAARLGSGVLTNNTPFSYSGTSYSFPNVSGMMPTCAIKQANNTTTACDLYIDWWACAQMSPASSTITGDTAPP